MKHKTLAAILCCCAIALASLSILPGRTNAALRQPAAGMITLDPNFNVPFFATSTTPARGVLLPSGKYVLFFNVDTLATQNTGPLVRFNADGSLDTTFSFSRDYAGANAVAPTADGKLIVAASKVLYGVSEPNQHQIIDILRLNDDGSIDPTFGPAQTTDGGEVRVLTVNSDGTIFVGGLFTAFNGNPTHGIVRLLADGTVDPNFASIAMTCSAIPFGSSGCGLWADPVVDADSKIIIAGDFVQVNGTDAFGVARLNSDGTLDTSFRGSGFRPHGSPNTPVPIRGIVIQSDGNIVIGGKFQGGNCGNAVPLVRLGTDGTRDQSYIYPDCLPPSGLFDVRQTVIDGSDRVTAAGLSVWRFNTDGSLDTTFHNPVLSFGQTSCADGGQCPEALNIAVADGGNSFFLGGSFADVDDVGGPANHWGAAKVSATDGSLDPSFTTSQRMGWKIEPNSFLRSSNELTLISFVDNAAGLPHLPPIPNGFGRLLSDGSVDSGYDPIASFDPGGPLGPNFISTGFTPFSDGSLLVTGESGNLVNYGRLLPDGTEDPNFQADPSIAFTDGIPRDDGKVVLHQWPAPNIFALPDPAAQAVVDGTEVRRINADGSLDSSFQLDVAIVPDTQDRDGSGNLINVYSGSGVLALTANDTVLFGYLSRDGSYHLVRLNADGSIDDSFQAQTFPVTLTSIGAWVNDPQNGGALVRVTEYSPTDLPVKQAKNVLDNEVVLLGSFTSYGTDSAHGMLRLNTDGSLDPGFTVGLGAQWTVTPENDVHHPGVDNLEVGLDDKLLVTGTFEAFNNTNAPGIINLNPDGTIDPDFIAPVTRQKYDYQPAYLKRQADGSFLLSGPYSRPTDNISPSFFRLLPPPGIDTPPGDDVTVDAGSVGSANDISVNFASVNDIGGGTSVALIDPQWAGELPPGYQLAGTDLSFEIYTTAAYTAPVTICFDVSSLSDNAFAKAAILHNDGTGLVDVTSSKDATTKTICATVDSLSPFVVADAKPITINVQGRPTQISEGASATYKVIAPFALPQTVTVSYAMSGTATLGSDYTLSGTVGQVTIPAGQSSASVRLKARIDHVTEGTETAVMTLLQGTGYQLGRKTQATVSILDSP
jgi:uncharacterized delta-60 repeat protein